jgi:hypothetical protein
MRTQRPARLLAILACTAILLLVAAPTALGKEGLSVNLLAPLPRDAEPGTKVPAFYTMTAITDDVESPLHSKTTFIRLYGRDGAVTEAVGIEQKTPGLYKAMIEIPAGGIARGEFGVRGPAKAANGKVVATDAVWAYDGIVVTAPIPAPVDPKAFQLPGTKPAVAPANGGAAAAPGTTSTPPAEPATTTLSFDPRLALAAGLALLAIVGGGIVSRRRRLQRQTAV